MLCGIGLATSARAQQVVPTLTGRVVDQGDILSPSAEETLTALLTAHEDTTSNQVAVLTIPSLDGEPIESYATRVAEAWGLGTAERDNGVLLVVATEDRKLRIEVGYGLEGALPDILAGRIIREEIVPYFREGNYERGVEMGVLALIATLEKQDAPLDAIANEDDGVEPVNDAPAAFRLEWWQVIFGIYFLMVVLLACVAAALALLEKAARRTGYFFFLLLCFFFIGWRWGYFVFWFMPGWLPAVVVAGLYAVFFWRLARRLDRDPSLRATWRYHLLVHSEDQEGASGGDEKASNKATSASAATPYPRRIQGIVLLAFVLLLALFLYTRWLPVIWLIVGVVLAWFCLSRIAEDAAKRKRRRSTLWTPFGPMPSGSSGSSRSRSRSYSSSSWSSSPRSSRSSGSWSGSSSSRSSSSRSSSSGSSFSGGGGSFGGGGASGGW